MKRKHEFDVWSSIVTGIAISAAIVALIHFGLFRIVGELSWYKSGEYWGMTHQELNRLLDANFVFWSVIQPHLQLKIFYGTMFLFFAGMITATLLAARTRSRAND